MAYLLVAILLVMYQKEILGTSFQNLEEGGAIDNHIYDTNVPDNANIATSTAVEDGEDNISI